MEIIVVEQRREGKERGEREGGREGGREGDKLKIRTLTRDKVNGGNSGRVGNSGHSITHVHN